MVGVRAVARIGQGLKITREGARGRIAAGKREQRRERARVHGRACLRVRLRGGVGVWLRARAGAGERACVCARAHA